MKVVIKTTKVVRETAFERRMREMNERMERQQAEMQARLDKEVMELFGSWRVFGVEQRIVETEEIVEVPTTIGGEIMRSRRKKS